MIRYDVENRVNRRIKWLRYFNVLFAHVADLLLNIYKDITFLEFWHTNFVGLEIEKICFLRNTVKSNQF